MRTTPKAFVGQNRDDTRAHNLSLVLNMVQRESPISRSQLTSTSGLNRSTISDLVKELEELGLVTEAESPSANGVGRPSLMVSASEDVVAFAVNPEIDATTVAMVSLSGDVKKKVRVLTGNRPEAEDSIAVAAREIKKMRAELGANARVVGVGAAIPGQVRVRDGIVRFAPHLNWVEVPFGSMLAQATGLPVYVDNDASIGSDAEQNFGAGRGYQNIVSMFAGSGGIGGGVIIEGQPLRGSTGYGGELGHARISSSKAVDFSGLPGTLEAMVRRDDLLEILKLDSATDEELDLELRRARAPKSMRLIEAQTEFLALAVANYVNIFNPELVIISGFLGSLFALQPERFIKAVKASALAAPQENILIRRGELGSNAVMLGAAALPLARLLQNPANFVSSTPSFKISRSAAALEKLN